MVSHKNYHLNTNEGFLISFNVQFNYIYFLTISLWEWKSKSIACLLSGSEHMYIGLGALKLMCTQYGFCGLGNLQECKANFFMKLGRAGNIFQSGSKMFSLGLLKGCGRGPQPLSYNGAPSLKSSHNIKLQS